MIDKRSAWPAELFPLFEKIPVLIEDLHAIITAVADEHAASGVGSDGVKRLELARSRAFFAPGFNELAVF